MTATKIRVLLVATLTAFLAPFMLSAVNIALPAIQQDLDADAVMLSWSSTAYLLSTCILLLPIGKMADIYGRKKIFGFGVLTFTGTAILCALSSSIEQLILFRIFQGAGGAMIVTAGTAILASVFEPSERGKAFGINVAAVYVGLSLGPFIGGILTQQLGWRSIFLTTIPFCLIIIAVGAKEYRGDWREAEGQKLDIRGSLLYAFGLSCLILGLTWLPGIKAWPMISAGIISLSAFGRRELRITNPIIELRLFRHNQVFAYSCLAALINYSATFAVAFMLSLYLQYIKGLTPQQAGTLMIAQPIVQAALSPLCGHLSDRIEPGILASAGMGLSALGLAGLTILSYDTSYLFIIATLVVLGVGFALFSSPNTNAIMSSVEPKYLGSASGAVSTMRNLGQILSMATATTLFAIFIGRDAITAANHDLFLKAFRYGFTLFAGVCTVGIYFSMARGKLRN